MIPATQDVNWMPYVGSAVFMVVLAWVVMRWMRRTVEKDLDPANTGKMRESMALKANAVPPTLVREALAKGLVTSNQLATMSPVERQFLFAQLAPKLSSVPDADGSTGARSATAAPEPAPRPQLGSIPLPLKPSEPPTPVEAPQLRSTQAIPIIPGKPVALPPLTPEQIAALGPPRPRPATPPATPPAPANPLDSRPRTPSGPQPRVSMAFAEEDERLRVFCPWCGARLSMPAFPPNVAFCDQCGAKTAVRTEEQGRLVINTAPPGVARRPIG